MLGYFNLNYCNLSNESLKWILKSITYKNVRNINLCTGNERINEKSIITIANFIKNKQNQEFNIVLPKCISDISINRLVEYFRNIEIEIKPNCYLIKNKIK